MSEKSAWGAALRKGRRDFGAQGTTWTFTACSPAKMAYLTADASNHEPINRQSGNSAYRSLRWGYTLQYCCFRRHCSSSRRLARPASPRRLRRLWMHQDNLQGRASSGQCAQAEATSSQQQSRRQCFGSLGDYLRRLWVRAGETLLMMHLLLQLLLTG